MGRWRIALACLAFASPLSGCIVVGRPYHPYYWGRGPAVAAGSLRTDRLPGARIERPLRLIRRELAAAPVHAALIARHRIRIGAGSDALNR